MHTLMKASLLASMSLLLNLEARHFIGGVGDR